MLKAGALFVAVTISFVIAVLLSLLITLSFHYKIQNRENLIQKRLERNVNSSLVLLLAGAEMEHKNVDLFEEGHDSVQLKRVNWGVFEVASVKAVSSKYSLCKTMQYGYVQDENYSAALYLTDLSRPLNLCGKTIIKGNCFLPEAGVKQGYIEGKGYEGQTLIYGTIKKSKNTLPSADKNISKQLSDGLLLGSFQNFTYKEISLENVDTLINSFLDTTLLIKTNGAGLSGKFISGNVIVYSENSILIAGDSKLEDVLIFAKNIKLSKGFKGNLQAFASDSIIIEEEVVLEYPSALGVLKNDHKTKQPFIKLMPSSIIKGMVFTLQSEYVRDLAQTLISVEKGALIVGQLYADGFADIKGEVRGSVWCNKFLLKTSSSVYENHLLDATIDMSKLSEHYVGSGLIAVGKRKKIIKWLE